MTKKVYRGQLCLTTNGEDDCLTGLIQGNINGPDILAEIIVDDIEEYGSYLSVRYFITDTEATPDVLEMMLANLVDGEADAAYAMRYSEITGYLWTDEELMVGGHDLLRELDSHLGQFLHMEIDFNKEAPNATR
jgi:hypothetical protein